jgi:hypothetical protein
MKLNETNEIEQNGMKLNKTKWKWTKLNENEQNGMKLNKTKWKWTKLTELNVANIMEQNSTH